LTDWGPRISASFSFNFNGDGDDDNDDNDGWEGVDEEDEDWSFVAGAALVAVFEGLMLWIFDIIMPWSSAQA